MPKNHWYHTSQETPRNKRLCIRNVSLIEQLGLPETVVFVGSYSFYICHVQSLEFPSSLEIISRSTCRQANWLVSVIIRSAKVIEDDAFGICYSLQCSDASREPYFHRKIGLYWDKRRANHISRTPHTDRRGMFSRLSLSNECSNSIRCTAY